MNRRTAKAWKKRGTLMHPSTGDLTAEDRVIEHERSETSCHLEMFVFEIMLWALFVRLQRCRRERALGGDGWDSTAARSSQVPPTSNRSKVRGTTRWTSLPIPPRTCRSGLTRQSEPMNNGSVFAWLSNGLVDAATWGMPSTPHLMWTIPSHPHPHTLKIVSSDSNRSSLSHVANSSRRNEHLEDVWLKPPLALAPAPMRESWVTFECHDEEYSGGEGVRDLILVQQVLLFASHASLFSIRWIVFQLTERKLSNDLSTFRVRRLSKFFHWFRPGRRHRLANPSRWETERHVSSMEVRSLFRCSMKSTSRGTLWSTGEFYFI